jgi:hypothetical protein
VNLNILVESPMGKLQAVYYLNPPPSAVFLNHEDAKVTPSFAKASAGEEGSRRICVQASDLVWRSLNHRDTSTIANAMADEGGTQGIFLGNGHYYPITLNAQNLEGFKNLRGLLSFLLTIERNDRS